ncbi:MAG: hypothetical protein K9G57_15215 [Ignavibacteriales bacterium]|nr:hypothetical protein [Ignavibacteriales bacterium]MCF8438195.1 hypothetical protein [Ignavibacteriales bacterium]
MLNWLMKTSENQKHYSVPNATIIFEVPSESKVLIRLFDNLGREIAEIINGFYNRGKYQVRLNTMDYASGACFYQVTAKTSRGEILYSYDRINSF